MTFRAVLLGMALGLLVSSLTYLNDVLARQAQLIGHFFPLLVVGLLVVIGVAINPLLARVGWSMRSGELAVACAIGFAACGWPGAGFFRGATANVAMPRHWESVELAWRAQHALAYVPHGSPDVAEGHVTDWSRLAARLGEEPWFSQLRPSGQRLVRRLKDLGAVREDERRLLLGELNQLIRGAGSAGAADALPAARWRMRARLTDAMPDALRPSPRGAHVLLPMEDRETLGGFVSGGARGVPWRAWREVAFFWGPVALTLGACAFCLSLIVHPQWSRHELLAYPIPRFIDEITRAGDADDPGRPPLLRAKGFWLALTAAMGIHLLNGLQGWVGAVPSIPLKFDFTGLHTLMPTAARLHETTAYTRPGILLSVVGFAFFLSGSVALSLGVSQLLYVFLASSLLLSGVTLGGAYGEASNGGLLRFGAYVAMACTIAYLGRRYYWSACRRAVGLGATATVPPYAVWSTRGLAVAMLASVLLLTRSGMGWELSFALVAMVLLTMLVLSRVVAETGAFFLQPSWLPFTVLTSLLGAEALGPTGFALFALGSIMLVGDPRETLMPFLTSAWRIADRPAGAAPARLAPAMGSMLMAGFIIAGVVTLMLQYRWGLVGIDRWTNRILPSVPFDALAGHLSQMSVFGTLDAATAGGAGLGWSLMSPSAGAWGWVVLGAVLVAAVSAARLRFAWWPLHPVVFVVWGTWPMTVLAASFLLGWVVKLVVTRLGGAAAYRSTVPVMVGLVAGELLGALFWVVVGLTYFLATNQVPPRYTLF